MSDQQGLEPQQQQGGSGGGIGGAFNGLMESLSGAVSALFGTIKPKRVRGKKLTQKGAARGTAIGAGITVSPRNFMQTSAWVGASYGNGSGVENSMEEITFDVFGEEPETKE